MSEKSRWEYYLKMRIRYQKANKAEKQKLIDEFCEVCGYHRKYAIMKLNKNPNINKDNPRKRCGRKAKYNTPGIIEFLKTLWRATNLICSKRMVASIPTWLQHYRVEEVELRLTENDKKKLESISSSTIDRLLKKYRNKFERRGLCTTKPGSMIKQIIPINTDQWDATKPGYIEADTVAHCGNSVKGDYINSLNIVDIATGWTSQRALWGKGEAAVIKAMQDIEENLPFRILGFDSDNGSEFLNYRLIKYFKERKHKVAFTRSRPNKKNDNAHVEQKNWTIVRQYIGYARLDNFLMTGMLNDIYKKELNQLTNFFLPSMKLIFKERIGSKIIKRHSKPETPYSRILESKYVDKKVKEKLQKQFERMDPYKIQKRISKKMNAILKMTYK